MAKKPLSAIEVFPYLERSGWGFLTSDADVPEAVKQKCVHWTVEVPTGDGSEPIDVYYHGAKPPTADRLLINSQIFTFYYRLGG